jgi:hypothetical protein
MTMLLVAVLGNPADYSGKTFRHGGRDYTIAYQARATYTKMYQITQNGQTV